MSGENFIALKNFTAVSDKISLKNENNVHSSNFTCVPESRKKSIAALLFPDIYVWVLSRYYIVRERWVSGGGTKMVQYSTVSTVL